MFGARRIAGLMLVVLLCVGSARAQFSEVRAADRVEAGHRTNLFATWEGRTSLDGAVVALPAGWSLQNAVLLRYGYEEVPLEVRRASGASRRYVVAASQTLHKPAELVLQVQVGSGAGPATWRLTPFVWRSSQKRQRRDDLSRRVTERLRVYTLRPAPEEANKALSLGDSAPLLLRRQALPALDGQAAYTVAFWMQTTGLGEVVLSTWTGHERQPYPLEIVVGPGGRLSYYRGQPGQHQALTTRTPVADGRWHHVAVTHDPRADRTMLFLDGTPADSLRGGSAESSGAQTPFAVGGRVPVEETQDAAIEIASYKGLLDELRLEPTAQTQDALQQGMRRSASASTPKGVYLGFEEELSSSLTVRQPERLRRVPARRRVHEAVRSLRARVQGAAVQLTWEMRNSPPKAFYVERSTDGRTFQQAGHIEGAAATKTGVDGVQHFRFKDTGVPDQQVLYYRIRQVRADSTEQVSGTLKIGLGAEEQDQTSLIGNFPNPFSTSTKIAYRTHQTQHVRLSVWNLSGHQVARLVDEVQQAGHHEVPFRAGSLPSGTYFARLQTPAGAESQKMTLMK